MEIITPWWIQEDPPPKDHGPLSVGSMLLSWEILAPPLLGLFTVIICISDRDVASKWVPLISMVLFTLSMSTVKGKNREGNRNR